MTQNIKTAIRPIFFQNDSEQWPYSTDGGTMFIVEYESRCYGLTAKHVLTNYDISQLVVARDTIPKKETALAPIDQVAFNNGDGDLADLAVIIFTKEIEPNFFRDAAYIIEDKTIGSTDTAHKLKVYGFLKDKTNINYDNESVITGYCDLEFHAVGETSPDPVLKSAMATYSNHNFDRITGISGAPVFDKTANKLCGMVLRGSLNNGNAKIFYIDVLHIVKILEAVSKEAPSISYMFHPKLGEL